MRKLLVADNSTTIQRVVELTFANEDIQVLAVGDGEQAIARIPVDRPDIVLVDIATPKRNGYEVSAFVKNHQELAHVPVLLLAGAFEPVDNIRAQEVRSDGVIVKPFDPRQMVARVRELLNPPRQPAPGEMPDAPGQFASLDDYFAHLDQALKRRAALQAQVVEPPAPPSDDSPTTIDVPTIASVLETEPSQPPPADTSAATAEITSHAAVPGRLEIPDDLVEEVTNRVLERLSTGSLREVVSAAVRDVIEQRRRGQMDRDR